MNIRPDDVADDVLSEPLRAEFTVNEFNPCAGQTLLSESERSRVWFIRLLPGERLGFHRHVLDYFWTALSAGTARSHIQGGRPTLAQYHAGQTRHLTFGRGEFMIHDLENVGATDLIFVTVEYLDSENAPLPLPKDVVPRGLSAGLVFA